MKKVKIGITIGDPSGIGPEITLKALKKFSLPKDCQISVFGDTYLWKNKILPKEIDFINVDSGLRNLPKGPSKEAGWASLLYLKRAIEYLKGKEINSLVTAPVSKEAISLNGINFIGHTEFLAEAFSVEKFAMMFVSDSLKVSLVTRHIPFGRVITELNPEMIYSTIILTAECLQRYFGITHPRIAVSGINPHASENGMIGDEEIRIILPAIKKAQRKNKNILGPFPADSIFIRAYNKEFDAVVSMYHDQGLIAFKLVAFNKGVNLTLGLPFIRTSVVHGTAFSLAGKNKADCSSMLEAIKTAYHLTKNQLKNNSIK